MGRNIFLASVDTQYGSEGDGSGGNEAASQSSGAAESRSNEAASLDAAELLHDNFPGWGFKSGGAAVRFFFSFVVDSSVSG